MGTTCVDLSWSGSGVGQLVGLQIPNWVVYSIALAAIAIEMLPTSAFPGQSRRRR